jgi:hypothetical protein
LNSRRAAFDNAISWVSVSFTSTRSQPTRKSPQEDNGPVAIDSSQAAAIDLQGPGKTICRLSRELTRVLLDETKLLQTDTAWS